MEHEDVVKLAEEKYPINPEWNDHSKSISANRKAGFIDGYQEALKSKPLDDGIKYLIEDKNTEEWYGIDLSEGMKPLPNKSSFFTKDANEALHFNTSKEAQDHLDKFLKWDWCHVTEHKFVDDGQEGKGLDSEAWQFVKVIAATVSVEGQEMPYSLREEARQLIRKHRPALPVYDPPSS